MRVHALTGAGAGPPGAAGAGRPRRQRAYEGAEVPIYYDPMISKLVTWADDRPSALARMKRALAEYEVRGIRTTIPFFRWMLEDEDFRAARFDTTFIDRKLGSRNGQPLSAPDDEHAVLAAVAVAVRQFTSAAVPADTTPAAPSRWQQAARKAPSARRASEQQGTHACSSTSRLAGRSGASRWIGGTAATRSPSMIASSRWIRARSAGSRCRCWCRRAAARCGAWRPPSARVRGAPLSR